MNNDLIVVTIPLPFRIPNGAKNIVWYRVVPWFFLLLGWSITAKIFVKHKPEPELLDVFTVTVMAFALGAICIGIMTIYFNLRNPMTFTQAKNIPDIMRVSWIYFWLLFSLAVFARVMFGIFWLL